MRVVGTVDEDGEDAGGVGTADVALGLVADVPGVPRLKAHSVEDMLEYSGVGLVYEKVAGEEHIVEEVRNTAATEMLAKVGPGHDGVGDHTEAQAHLAELGKRLFDKGIEGAGLPLAEDRVPTFNFLGFRRQTTFLQPGRDGRPDIDRWSWDRHREEVPVNLERHSEEPIKGSVFQQAVWEREPESGFVPVFRGIKKYATHVEENGSRTKQRPGHVKLPPTRSG